MNIYKIAQAGDFMDIELIFENGEVKIVIENGPTLSCKDLPSNELLEKLFSGVPEGFGSPLYTKIDEGRTGEFYEEQRQEAPEEHVIDDKPIRQPITTPQIKQRQKLEL